MTKTNNPNLGWGAPLKRWSSRWKRRWPRRVLVDASERVCVCISVVIRTDSLSTRAIATEYFGRALGL